ncbi:MAG TPA: hemerythrin domain-containing protein, partial [Telluria sp.]|nr:hemerythrin domain-containing protein [Telluria sp.]
EQIDHHVEEEEGEMFPKVRKSGLDLVALGQQMAARKAELQGAGAEA